MKRLLMSAVTAAAFALAVAGTSWAEGNGQHSAARASGGHARAVTSGSGGQAVPRGSAGPRGYGRGRGFYGGYYGGYYGGIYGGYYGPWYGWGYGPWWYGDGWGWAPSYGGGYAPTGGLRLQVTPDDAQVYVDGRYAGVVSDYDGLFQHLDLPAGGHHIDLRAPGFRSTTFDIYIQPDHTIDYKAKMVGD